MIVRRITNISDLLYPLFYKLYKISFPVFEQRNEDQQIDAFCKANYHLNIYQESDDSIMGFIAYWEFETYLYIEHFAIDTLLRGQGYGKKILKKLINDNQKFILLEIDPVKDEISEARLRFYKKCGFFENPYKHIHPPYIKGNEGHSLEILTSERSISNDEYIQFKHDLEFVVMA